MQIDNVNIVMKPVNEIIPYWRNPRRNDRTVDELVKSIPKHGFNVPIVVDKNGVVVKGHARLKAAKRLGMEKVPVIVSDASEDAIKADRIADNKIQELSSWDFAKLDVELDRLDGMEFKSLFRPEDAPDMQFDMPDVEFKPVGLDFGDSEGDYDFGGMDAQPGEKAVYGDYTGYEQNPACGGGESVPVGVEQAQAEPQEGPKKLKTLCPYCGKVVILDV